MHLVLSQGEAMSLQLLHQHSPGRQRLVGTELQFHSRLTQPRPRKSFQIKKKKLYYFDTYFSTASGDPLITVPPPSPLSYSTPVTSSRTADICLPPQSKDRDILVSRLLIGKGRLNDKLL